MNTETELPGAAAMLRWLADMGADEALDATPVDRFTVTPVPFTLPQPASLPGRAASAAPALSRPEPLRPTAARPMSPPPGPTVPPAPRVMPVAPSSPGALSARDSAAGCTTLDALREAVLKFDGCVLKQTAKHTVFADGPADAPVMLIGEAPGRDEDLQGLPFVGRSGQLLDRMLASIGLSRQTNTYITNVIFWRPPGNRPPTPEEAASCAPFLTRHIELKKPRIILLVGGTPVRHVLNWDEGITRIRGRWGVYRDGAREIPVLPTFHPAYVLRQPAAKRLVWQDLQAFREKLQALPAT